MKNIIISFCLLLLANLAIAQEKFEKEYRIKAEEAPKNAVSFVKNNNFKKRVKWYAEESNDGNSFEAKVCHNRHLYSIEFSEEGDLLDIEKKIDFDDVPEEIQEDIEEYLGENYTKFKFKKTQIQFKGDPNELTKVFETDKIKEINSKIAYELIVKAKKEGGYEKYEMLFDENGKHVKTLPIAATFSLNLEF